MARLHTLLTHILLWTVTYIAMSEQTFPTTTTVYTRWGRDVCPCTADTVYSGLAAASAQNVGGGSNYMCLPEIPEYTNPEDGKQDRRSYLYAVEYRAEYPPLESLISHDVPCVVCESIGRSTVLMVPARKSCPSGWTLEYYGFLVAERSIHERTQYVCLDGEPTARQGTANRSETTFATMQPVEGQCSSNGGFPCGPYKDGYELTCAVCTK